MEKVSKYKITAQFGTGAELGKKSPDLGKNWDGGSGEGAGSCAA